MSKRINLWSGPRNISTALMYSFAQREDCQVVDEPFYAYYLKLTGFEHPGVDEVLKSMSFDKIKILKDLGASEKPIIFYKHMAHHFVDLPWSILDEAINIFLIREPQKVISSYTKQIETPTVDGLGYLKILEMVEREKRTKGQAFVIDSDDILKNPETSLRAICNYSNIPFDNKMLHWSKGGIPEDGVWAKYWYTSVHNSEGFKPLKKSLISIPERLNNILQDCEKIYELLQNEIVKI